MKILKLSPYYNPERVSNSHLSEDLEEAYVKNGFDVEIYTPVPTRGISKEIRKKYKKIKYEEKYDGKIVIRRFNLMPEGKRPALRALRYILSNIIQYNKGIGAKNIDILVGESTPPTQGVLMALVKKRLKVPFVYCLQDIFPDSLVVTGLTKKGSLVWKIGKAIENYSYKNADRIIVISEDMRQNIINKGVSDEKIRVISNWTDENQVVPVPKEKNTLFDEFMISRNCFNVTYAGNLGNAQDIDTFLHAAQILKNEDNIKFVIFGTGAKEDEYKRIAAENDLKNVSFYPLQPQERISEVYSLGDISLVSCKPGVGASAVPSKTWNILSSGTAVLACFDENTELHRLIDKYKFGKFVPAGNAIALADTILKLSSMPETCREMGTQGRQYILEHLTKDVCTKKYVEIIKELMPPDQLQ